MHIAAAEWIMPLACTRGSGICMADKLLLLAMWGRAPFDLRGPATGRQVYPSRRMLAEATGQTLDAVRDQLRRLAAAGWIRVDGDGWALAWVTPFEIEATQAREPATQTAEPDEHPGDLNRLPQATQTQGEATQTAGPGDSNRRPSKQEISTTAIEHTTARAPANSPEIPDTSPVANPTPEATPPRKPRTRKPADPKQNALGFAAPDPVKHDLVAELLEAHRLARIEAGVTGPAWPVKAGRSMQSMRAGCAAAIKRHGAEWCRAMLAWRGAIWARDPSQWAYSTSSVWTQPSIDHAKRNMGGAARASPGTLPVPAQLPDRSLPGFTWTPPT